jgi:hypothetical protein
MLYITVNSLKMLEMISLILTTPAARLQVSSSKAIITTTCTDLEPLSALIIPTPLAMSTYTPALSPNPGVSQITKVFLNSDTPILYISFGMGTAFM